MTERCANCGYQRYDHEIKNAQANGRDARAKPGFLNNLFSCIEAQGFQQMHASESIGQAQPDINWWKVSHRQMR